jgi:metallophosphoesterase (TIGR00282 family)
MKLVFIGDVVGGTGRRALEAVLPDLRREYEPDFVVVNGENSAGGLGINERIGRAWLDGDSGIDAITLGNHAYKQRDVYEYLDREQRIVRPANYPKGNPGRGVTVIEKGAGRLAVVNLSGTVFLDAARSPFSEVDAILADLRGQADWILVDFHAEATSEKVAMGWHLDGRVTACVGTHTHVPTADDRILPGGTAYQSDLGCTGPAWSIIGFDPATVLPRFLNGLPTRFEVGEGAVVVNATQVDVDPATGRALAIERIQQVWEG